MTKFDVYIIIFLVGGIVIGSLVYQGVKGLLMVMNRFNNSGYPMYNAAPMVAPTAVNQQPVAADNTALKWLLFITICLVAYNLLKNPDNKAIDAPLNPSSVEAASPTGVLAKHKTYTRQIKETVPSKKERPFSREQAINVSPFQKNETYFLQITAGTNLNVLYERARVYQTQYPIRIGIGEGAHPFKLLVGPFNSEENRTSFMALHPELKSGWPRQASEFSKVVLVDF